MVKKNKNLIPVVRLMVMLFLGLAASSTFVIAGVFITKLIKFIDQIQKKGVVVQIPETSITVGHGEVFGVSISPIVVPKITIPVKIS